MAKRLSGALDVLGVVDPYGAEDAGGERLITPALDACRPDPRQPRRLLPDDLRERLANGASPAEVLDAAWQRCLGEDLYQALRSHEVSAADALARRQEWGVPDLALYLTLEGIVELADSIVRHGLRQPINVYDLRNGRYRIAEGERRWWAHVHLAHVVGRLEYQVIPARVQEVPGDALEVLARQHAENAHRRDLSAVARARAIAAVRDMTVRDFSGTASSQQLASRSEPTHFSGTGRSQEMQPKRGRPALAVSEHDLDERTGERLAGLTGRGMSGRMVRNYLALLSLPAEAQALAEAAALSEAALRPIVSLDDPQTQVRLVRALAAGEMTPAQAAAEVKQLAAQGRRRDTDGDETVSRFRSSLRFVGGDALPDPAALAAGVAQLPPKKRAEMLDQARRYAAFLEAFLASLDFT